MCIRDRHWEIRLAVAHRLIAECCLLLRHDDPYQDIPVAVSYTHLISGMDVGSATLKVNDDGFYSLIIGAADMGTGCDTTLAQIATEVLDCDLSLIHI